MRRSIARLLVLVLALSAIAVPAGARTDEARGGERVRVRIVDNRFRPRNITIARGTRVRWVNRGSNPTRRPRTPDLWDSGTPLLGRALPPSVRPAGDVQLPLRDPPDDDGHDHRHLDHPLRVSHLAACGNHRGIRPLGGRPSTAGGDEHARTNASSWGASSERRSRTSTTRSPGPAAGRACATRRCPSSEPRASGPRPRPGTSPTSRRAPRASSRLPARTTAAPTTRRARAADPERGLRRGRRPEGPDRPDRRRRRRRAPGRAGLRRGDPRDRRARVQGAGRARGSAT